MSEKWKDRLTDHFAKLLLNSVDEMYGFSKT